MAEDNVLLSWSGFQNNQFSTFAALAKERDFSDVTLVGDDHQPIPGHQVILASGSPYLKTLLLRHHHSNPLVLLPGLGQGVLQHLVDFLYLGQTTVPQHMLNRLLQAAETFQIKGLQGDYGTESKQFKQMDKALQFWAPR